MEKRLLNIKEVSEYLNVSVHTIYSWVSRKKIPFCKLNGVVRFQLDSIQEWVKQSETEAAEKE
ncbi:helix-turn-helix domain-containing protein [bacterium]|nr:helix-turn-helix domain-containing protein [bacterium]